MGRADGEGEGLEEGLGEGLKLGKADGEGDGFKLGRADGEGEGKADGKGEGTAEGKSDGEGDGFELGEFEGELEGNGLGRAEGRCEGRELTVGESVLGDFVDLGDFAPLPPLPLPVFPFVGACKLRVVVYFLTALLPTVTRADTCWASDNPKTMLMKDKTLKVCILLVTY